VAVFLTIKPVTQVAEVAVNSAVRKLAPLPSFVAAGNVNSRVPTVMSERKLSANIRTGRWLMLPKMAVVNPERKNFGEVLTN